MVWYQVVRVKLNERVVVLDNSRPLCALGPGKHRIWGDRLTEVRFCTDQLLFTAPPEVRALLPKEWYREVTLGSRERGVLMRDGRPTAYLRPGVHRFWTLDPSASLTVFHLDQPMPELSDELVAVLPAAEYVRRLIEAHERGLLFVDGKLERVLTPGKYCFWSTVDAPARIEAVDMRTQQASLAAQELMTRDKVTLRLSITVEYGVVDPALVRSSVSDARDAVYLLVQLAARDFVGSVTLDQLLEGRQGMTEYLHAEVAPRALAFGVRVARVGVKDIVLPGEMKALLNRVIEAEKEASANVILRREEASAMRLLASSARMMTEQPALMRLKELETLKEMASHIDEVRLLVGSDGLGHLLPQPLLGGLKS